MAIKKNDQDWRPPLMVKDKHKAPKLDPSKRTLERGWFAAVTLKPSVSRQRCYVGQIQAFDDHAIRLTLVDRISGTATRWDLYVPHDMIENVLLGTDQHFLDNLGEEFGRWQTEVNHPTDTPPESSAASKEIKDTDEQ